MLLYIASKNTKTYTMKKNLFAIGLLAAAISANAQVLTHVDNTAVL